MVLAWLIGMAKPSPMLPVCWLLLPRVRMAEVIPITRARASTSGPPEFPGLIDASVWIPSMKAKRGVRVADGLHHHGPVLGRHDALGHRARQSERGPDRQHRLTHLDGVGVAQLTTGGDSRPA